MKIHEYQAKDLFRAFGVPTQGGAVVNTPDEAAAAQQALGRLAVVKAQVHTGGRGKAGGVKLAATPDEAREKAAKILGLNIKGSIVKKLLIADAVDIGKEAYVAVTLNRSKRGILFMCCAEGGMEIEELAVKSPEKILRVTTLSKTFPKAELKPVAAAMFGPEHEAVVLDALEKIFNLYIAKDCTLVEINPLVLTKDNQVIAVDGKVNFDDNALFRHPDIEAMRDLAEEDPNEMLAKEKGLSFVQLDGYIGCMVNGAGLAMATMDMIKLYGGDPANFLDVGGSSNPDKVVEAFKIILGNPKVKAVLINIFGGITRCDDIARGILTAYDRMAINVPVVVRLTGTNSAEGLKLLQGSKLLPAATFAEAVKKIIVAAGGVVNQVEEDDKE